MRQNKYIKSSVNQVYFQIGSHVYAPRDYFLQDNSVVCINFY